MKNYDEWEISEEETLIDHYMFKSIEEKLEWFREEEGYCDDYEE